MPNKTKRAVWQRRPKRPSEAGRLSGGFLILHEDERRRLGLDLHDSTAQSLAALTINLDLIEERADELDSRARRILEESLGIVRQCFQEIRALADLLYPSLIEEIGVAVALERFVGSFSELTGVTVEFHGDDRVNLPAQAGTTLFRLVEGWFREQCRRASTDPVVMRLKRGAKSVELSIQQSGRGARPAPRVNPDFAKAPALQRLLDRMQQLGGVVEIGESTLHVRLPVEELEEDEPPGSRG
jgi:signal transduction histidine kinase